MSVSVCVSLCMYGSVSVQRPAKCFLEVSNVQTLTACTKLDLVLYKNEVCRSSERRPSTGHLSWLMVFSLSAVSLSLLYQPAVIHTVYPRSEMFSRSSRYSEAQPEQAEAKRRSA